MSKYTSHASSECLRPRILMPKRKSFVVTGPRPELISLLWTIENEVGYGILRRTCPASLTTRKCTEEDAVVGVIAMRLADMLTSSSQATGEQDWGLMHVLAKIGSAAWRPILGEIGQSMFLPTRKH